MLNKYEINAEEFDTFEKKGCNQPVPLPVKDMVHKSDGNVKQRLRQMQEGVDVEEMFSTA